MSAMPFGSLNSDIFKYFLLLCTAPLWFPFVKAVFKELNDALVAEGGLFGRPPTDAELRALRRDPNLSPSPLINRERDPDDPRQPLGGARTGPAGASAGTGSRPTSGATARQASPAVGFGKTRPPHGFSRRDARGG
jgi:hypothetical protein